MRVALHSVLREGHEEAYDAAHATIPDDLVAAFARVGIHDWSIWRSGRDLFHLVECDDFEKAMRLLEDDPADRRWQASIGRHVDHFVVGADGRSTALLPVWTLTAQRDGGRSAPA